MRILLISTSYNGLCQRAHIELEEHGHEVSITFSLSENEMRMAVLLFQPDLILCPYLKERVPEDIWRRHTCIIVHPGIKGDRGPSSLDWAITDKLEEWGVTALQAADEMDAGDIWATAHFSMRSASKASLYRREVTQAAVRVILESVRRYGETGFEPEPLDYSNKDVRGRLRPPMKQSDRRINWGGDTTRNILDKIHAADSAPGVLEILFGEEYYLYGAHEESALRGEHAGEIIGKRNGAVCFATCDGAVWVSHLKKKHADPQRPSKNFKLPAALLLMDRLRDVPERPVDIFALDDRKTFQEIRYQESNSVGYLHFDFHNGAMSTEQCLRLKEAYQYAVSRPTRVIVLMGGTDFWSNGIHLNIIEAADHPADESWRNINAIDDLILDIINTTSKLVVSALWGSAGAGGAIMPLAADRVWARAGCVVNPHYKTMGLYGSEYWTYLLPKRVGPGRALELIESTLPLGMAKAKRIGFIDDILPDAQAEFIQCVRDRAESLAHSFDYDALVAVKKRTRAADEAAKPLSAYRAAELQTMRAQFYDDNSSYHLLRHRFVHKVKPAETGICLAKHRRFECANLEDLYRPPSVPAILPAPEEMA